MFDVGVLPHTGRKTELDLLRTYLEAIQESTDRGLVVCIGPIEQGGNPFEEESRAGGLGKTYFLKEARKHYFEDNGLTGFGENYELIDFAIENKTRYEVISGVVERICWLDFVSKYKHLPNRANLDETRKFLFPSFHSFAQKIDRKRSQETQAREDLSAEGLQAFSNDTDDFLVNCNQNLPYALFMDSFDSRYIGSELLFDWLTQRFFPFLAIKLKIHLIVSGRKSFDTDPYQIRRLVIRLNPFDESEIKEFIGQYFGGDHTTYIKIQDEMSDPSMGAFISRLTQGKPILLSIMCEFIRAGIQSSSEPSRAPITDFFNESRIGKMDPNAPFTFKRYLLTRLNRTVYQDRYEAASIIWVLSLAEFGLDAEGIAIVSGSPDQKDYIGELIDKYFNQKQLSFVKDFEIKGIRYVRLHDEVIELMRVHHWQVQDPLYKKRNDYFKRILAYYRQHKLEKMRLSPSEQEAARLEYLYYALQRIGRREEEEALYACMYEFLHTLDEHPTYASRVLNKAEEYLLNKRLLPAALKPQTEDTLTEDDRILLMIPLRRVEYFLTERASHKDWLEKVNELLDQVEALAQGLRGSQNNSISAQCKVFRGESMLWTNRFEKGVELIRESLSEFYLAGDSTWVAWSLHLLGFQQQRQAHFEQAYYFHLQALDACLNGLFEFTHNWEHESLNAEKLYLKELATKILIRATGNLSSNYFYRGNIYGSLILRLGLFHLPLAAREKRRSLTSIFIDYTLLRQRPLFGSIRKELQNADIHGIDPLLAIRVPLIFSLEAYLESNAPLLHHMPLPKAFEAASIQVPFGGQHLLYVSRQILEKEIKYIQQSDPLKLSQVEATAKIQSTSQLLTSQDLDTRSIPVNREMSEWYYTFGRTCLTTPIKLQNGNTILDYASAEIAFRNAYQVALAAKFRFMEAQALEALIVLNYMLSNGEDHHPAQDKMLEYEHQLDVLKKELKREKVFTFGDIFSRHYVLMGDRIFERSFSAWKLLNQPSSNIPVEFIRQAVGNFAPAFEYYAEALAEGIQHSYDQYLLVVEAVSKRLAMLNDVGRDLESMDRYGFVKQAFTFARINELDTNFEEYLRYLLAALSLKHLPDEYARPVIREVLQGIQRYIRQIPFKKAAILNLNLLQYYERKLDAKGATFKTIEDYTFSAFQQAYCYYSAGDIRSAVLVMEEVENKVNDSKRSVGLNGVIRIAKGILSYRTGEFRFIKRYALGERSLFVNKIGLPNLINGEQSLRAGLDLLIQADCMSLDKKYQKLFAEGLMRLGEIYLVLDAPWEPEGMALYPAKHRETLIQLGTSLSKDSVEEYHVKPALFYFYHAYLLARHINDPHRMQDCLMLIATYHYHKDDQLTDDQAHLVQHYLAESREVVIEKPLKDGSIETAFSEHYYPVDIAKSYMLAGNLCFSRLFVVYPPEYNPQSIDLHVYAQSSGFGVEKAHLKIEALESEDLLTPFATKTLREMLWNYLYALNLTAETDKVNETMNLMLQDISRRIRMIYHAGCIEALLENFDAIWNQFERISRYSDIRQSFLNILRIHYTALATPYLAADPLLALL